jgi:hypothetical protein
MPPDALKLGRVPDFLEPVHGGNRLGSVAAGDDSPAQNVIVPPGLET